LLLARALLAIGRNLSVRGNLAGAEACWVSLSAIADETGHPVVRVLPPAVLGFVRTLQGRFAEAFDLFSSVLPQLEAVQEWEYWNIAQSYSYFALVLMGRHEEAAAALERLEAAAAAQESPMARSLIEAMTAFAAGFAAADDAEARARGAIESMRASGNPVLLPMVQLSLAWARARAGAHDEAAAICARLEPILERVSFGDVFRAVAAEIALLGGRIDEALARADAVARRSAKDGYVFAGGLAERVAAQALAAQGADGALVRQRLRRAAELLQQAGATVEAERARAQTR
jgi:tetratricopeptide (TPR) repeat protein